MHSPRRFNQDRRGRLQTQTVQLSAQRGPSKASCDEGGCTGGSWYCKFLVMLSNPSYSRLLTRGHSSLQSKPAQLKSFHLTAQIYKSVPLVLGLTYLAFAPTTDPSPLFGPARYASQYLSHQFFLNMFRATVGFHALEALYSMSLCRKRTGFVTAVSYLVLLATNFYSDSPLVLFRRFMALLHSSSASLSGWT